MKLTRNDLSFFIHSVTSYTIPHGSTFHLGNLFDLLSQELPLDAAIKTVSGNINSQRALVCFVKLYFPFKLSSNCGPLHWCLLADICNHTWIPECGSENDEDIHSRRLFIDECDMFEYNCDYVKDYYVINYSDCFNLPTTPCPPRKPCPTCPKGLRLGDGNLHIAHRRMPVKPTTLGVSLPERMLKGKRRYTPTWRKKTRRTTRPIKRAPITTTKIVRTMVIKTEKVMQNGKMMIKVVKGYVVKGIGRKTTKNSDDFLE